MDIVYKLFKPEVVSVGDLFWEGVGGFTVQPLRVETVTSSGFTYRNDKFSVGYNFKGDFLSGMLERRTPDRIERYVSEAVLETLKYLGERIEQ